MKKCCVCGKEIREDDDLAIIDMPFAGKIVNFCNEECMDKVTKE